MTQVFYIYPGPSHDSFRLVFKDFLVPYQARDDESVDIVKMENILIHSHLEEEVSAEEFNAVVFVAHNEQLLEPVGLGLVLSVNVMVNDMKEVQGRDWVVIWQSEWIARIMGSLSFLELHVRQ